MIDCTNVRMREALPEYMHGLLDLRERLLVQAHLAGCGACSAELAVLERCRSAMSAVPVMDTRRVVAALPAPPARRRRSAAARRPPAIRELPLPPRPITAARRAATARPGGRRLGWMGAAWRAAAVALLMVGSLAVIVGQRGHWTVAEGMIGARSGNAAGPAGSGSAGQRASDSVMLAASAAREGVDGGQLDTSRDAPVLSLAGGLSELSDAALVALLGEVDAMEALPMVEPPPVSAFVVAGQSGAL
ncbi:MAG: zf-HC2 domain-containing protein [Gemmatimonadaceae bacterium]